MSFINKPVEDSSAFKWLDYNPTFDLIDIGKNMGYSSAGTVPVVSGSSATTSTSSPLASSSPDSSTDMSGYDQAQWDLDATRQLLDEQRAYNSAEAQKNREWQERMSNTAYQRAVQDLEAAGLNKWLAVTGGNGASASTPSGSSASSSSGDASTPSPVLAKQLIQTIGNMLSSGMSILKVIAKI